jgi:hypothetical protein
MKPDKIEVRLTTESPWRLALVHRMESVLREMEFVNVVHSRVEQQDIFTGERYHGTR